jgi:hypothetical protein
MFNEKDRAEALLTSGLDKHLSLTRSIFLLGKYFKYCNIDIDVAKEKILEWLIKQDKHLRYKDANEKLDSVLSDAYTKDYNFIDNISIDIWLSEMLEINKCRTKKMKMVMLSLLYLSKIYSDKEDVFYCSFAMLSKLSTMNFQNMAEMINKLEHNNMIKVIERDKIQKIVQFNNRTNNSLKTKVYKYPNKYRVLINKNYNIDKVKLNDNIIDDVIIYNIKDVECLENHLIEIYDILINKYKLNVSIRFNNYIKKNKMNFM